jgi:threonylcarbamoyladenosine tRNA methylthiotransferase MtaB
MPQLAPAVVRERAARLRAAGAAALAADLSARVGQVTEVLIEGRRTGRAACYARVDFAAARAPGSIERMRLVASTRHSLVGAPDR